jgi:hypothetical protein
LEQQRACAHVLLAPSHIEELMEGLLEVLLEV